MLDEATRNASRGLGLLILRVGAGVLMMYHGWGKVQKIFAGDFTFADPIGLGPELSLVLAAGAEFGLAALVVLGLGTRLAAAPIVLTMMVAAFVQHAADPFAKKELALVFALMFLVITLTGPGRFSLDALAWPALKRRRERKKKAA
ncbi:MAG: DoxX family protein [Planctomycetes bacterium]|nr:DoxX family protein [Planctomycetota bacterium]MCB9934725.1 DoxX family protein [Planctomycetota bacterium]